MPHDTIVYIDGFNLYYGALRGTPYKWLDLDRLFSLLRPHDHLVAIRYFSALVSGPTRANQDTYLRALATTPRVHVTLGNFKAKRVRCLVTDCPHPGSRLFETLEEKRTDVNIAVHILDDVYSGACGQVVLVSGDSDLVPALRMVRVRYPGVPIQLYVPANHRVRAMATELRSAADKARELPLNLLHLAQFPDPIDHEGNLICKPESW